MPIRWPSPGLLLITLVSVASFFGLAAWAWGDVAGLASHPARVAGLAIIAVAAIASLFSGIHLGGCSRPDAHGRWRLIPLALISLGLAWFPPYADRRNLWTVDGDIARAVGLILLALGAVMRVGPMFVLGDRFTWPLATQPGHRMLTTGFFRRVRHPSYSGALIGAVGWVLLFRSGPGLILVALLFPFFLPVIHSEEELLVQEFGEDYQNYRRRTWTLIPWIY